MHNRTLLSFQTYGNSSIGPQDSQDHEVLSPNSTFHFKNVQIKYIFSALQFEFAFSSHTVPSFQVHVKRPPLRRRRSLLGSTFPFHQPRKLCNVVVATAFVILVGLVLLAYLSYPQNNHISGELLVTSRTATTVQGCQMAIARF